MKKTILLSLMLGVLPWMAMAQDPGDDIYFVPKKQKKTEKVDTVAKGTTDSKLSSTDNKGVSTVVVRDYTGRVRDIDEYNRREFSAGKNEFSVKNDTLYIDERADSDLPGHWVNEFNGSQADYEYAVRLIRFRDPAYAIPVSSPLYGDLVYGIGPFPSWDWNIYDDGMYAYVFPSYTNSLWWDWRYDPWWRYNHWYWDDPFYYGWGCYWGASHWGWHYGHYYHPHYYHPWYGGGHVSYRPAPRDNGFRREDWRGAANRVVGTTGNRSDWKGSASRNNGTGVTTGTSLNRQSFGGIRTSGNPTRVVRPSNNSQSSSVRNTYSRNLRNQFRVNNSGTSTTRNSSSYIRPSSRPHSLEYNRPSSTRVNTNTRPSRSENTQRVERSSFDRSSFNSGSGGSVRRSVGTGGGGNSRGRR